jgi:hypothetical protein
MPRRKVGDSDSVELREYKGTCGLDGYKEGASGGSGHGKEALRPSMLEAYPALRPLYQIMF